MRISLIYVFFIILLSKNAFGQTEKEAIGILDKFSATALKAPSITMKFDLVKIDEMEKTKDTLKGSIILSKDSYKLEMADNITWFNGLATWSYLPAEKEVTITKPDRKDHSFQNKPSSIFSMYKKDFKCRLVEEKTGSYIIDLYPEDIKNELIRVRLVIGKPLLDLKSFEYKRRDGIVITINVKEYDLKQKADTETFSFHADRYKGVEVIDMR